jgi:hypothetical protein
MMQLLLLLFWCPRRFVRAARWGAPVVVCSFSPPQQARWIGVKPSAPISDGSQPASNRMCTASALPLKPAPCPATVLVTPVVQAGSQPMMGERMAGSPRGRGRRREVACAHVHRGVAGGLADGAVGALHRGVLQAHACAPPTANAPHAGGGNSHTVVPSLLLSLSLAPGRSRTELTGSLSRVPGPCRT